MTDIKCSICGGEWSQMKEACEDCGITGLAIALGPSRMRRYSKQFRVTSAYMTKKRRKHGRARPGQARLVIKRRRLRQSEAAQLAAWQAATLRAGHKMPKPEKGTQRDKMQLVGNDSVKP